MTKNLNHETLIGQELLKPVPLFFAALLVLNDWFFKPHALLPSWATGKLSDIAGLYFFPLALSAGFGCVLGVSKKFCKNPNINTKSTKRRLRICYLLTGVFFLLIKTMPFFNDLTESIFTLIFGRSTVVMDHTDLYCLPVLWLSYKQALTKIPIKEAK